MERMKAAASVEEALSAEQKEVMARVLAEEEDLLETGQLEADLTRVMARYGFADAMDLVERKRAGERVGLDPTLLETWRPRVEELFVRLDGADDASALPAEPPNEGDVREWLLEVRRSRLF
jgi:uncharacterized protein